eukprot:IDg7613t1
MRRSTASAIPDAASSVPTAPRSSYTSEQCSVISDLINQDVFIAHIVALRISCTAFYSSPHENISLCEYVLCFLSRMGEKGLLRSLEPGEKAPPPPGWIIEWSAQSMGGICGGLAWGGYQGLLQARAAGVSKTPKDTASKYFVRGALWGGSRVGVFAALFSGIALAAEQVRSKRDAANYAGAAASTAAMYARRAIAASAPVIVVVAAAAGGVLGAVQIELERRVGGKLFDAANVEPQLPSVAESDVRAVVSAMEEQLAAGASLVAN